MEKKVKAKSSGLKSALIAVAASTALWAIFSGAGALQKFELRVYDMLLATRPITEKADDLTLVEIDDASLDKLGPWPWSREIIGDVLLRLSEAGARCAVFDIEYLSPYKVAVNPDDAKLLKEKAGSAEGKALAAEVFRDNDEFFSKAIQFFGNTWLTINKEQIISVSEEDDEYARRRFLTNNVLDPDGLIKKGNEAEDKANGVTPGFSPAIHRFIKMAAGAGFTNIIVDKDGTRRRVELLNFQKGGYLGQLLFAPLLRELDVQKISRTKSGLTLHGALKENGGRGDIK
ncbi:MAG: CHASE2 domain-containing protein, partial [Treponema sp.]|nr:CHASE2 domain-containing protein [Treponema sp.]